MVFSIRSEFFLVRVFATSVTNNITVHTHNVSKIGILKLKVLAEMNEQSFIPHASPKYIQKKQRINSKPMK